LADQPTVDSLVDSVAIGRHWPTGLVQGVANNAGDSMLEEKTVKKAKKKAKKKSLRDGLSDEGIRRGGEGPDERLDRGGEGPDERLDVISEAHSKKKERLKKKMTEERYLPFF